MNKLRKGDTVIAITGRDKGKRGTIVSRIDDDHLLVEGLNLSKRHVKPNPMKGVSGGIQEKSMPIHQSNLAIFNSATGKGDRVGVKQGDDGRKVRVFKSSGAEIPTAKPSSAA